MGTTPNLPSMEMTPMPVPSGDIVKPQPARAPEPLPTEAGYARKGGQAANVIANFLQGMAAGKAYQEQKLQQKAQSEVMNSQWQYQFLQSVASDPNQTKEKRDQATKLLPGAWTDMINSYQKYVSPSEEEQKGKSKMKKVGERLTRGVRAEKPQLIGAEQFEMLKKMGPLAAQPNQPSTQQKEEQLHLQNAETAKKRMDTANAELDEANQMIKDGGLRDPDKRQTVLERVTMAQNTLGNVSPKDLPDPIKEQYDRATTQTATTVETLKGQLAQDAAKAYQKQRSGETLSATEQQTLNLFLPEGKPPDPHSIFMKMKGQEYTDPVSGQKKKIDTDLDAYNAFLSNESANAVKSKQREFDTLQQPVKDAIRSRWRLTHGGQEPTKDDLQNAWLDMYVGAGGTAPKQADYTIKKEQQPTLQSSIHSVVQMNGGQWSKFFTDQRKLDKDKKPTGNFDYTMKSRNDFPAEDQKEWDKAAQELAHEMQDHGFTIDQISTVVGREAAERMLKMTPTPEKNVIGTKKVRIRATNPTTGEKMDRTVDSTGTPEQLKQDFASGGWTEVNVEAVQ